MIASSGSAQDVAAAIRRRSVQAAAAEPSVRGADWRMATVATVNADGTVVTSDGITARRMETYLNPATSDLIYISQASSGNWLAWGRGSAGTFAVGEIVTKRKTSDTSRTNSTQAADPHLIIDVVPGEYRIDAYLSYTGDAAADLKLGFFSPASTAGHWYTGGSDSANTLFASTPNWGAVDITTTRPVAGVGAANVMACRPTGIAVVTATGQISLAWAQQVTNAIATTVRQHSWLELRRIA